MTSNTSERADPPTKIMILELDSVAQADRYALPRGADGYPNPQLATEEITGMLRVGRLISGTIYATDAMILDGTYFMALGPAGVLRALGANDGRFPLVITGPADSLRAGLEWRLNNPNFRWSLAGMEEHGTVPASYRSTWEEWLRYVENGLITYQQQTGPEFTMSLTDTLPKLIDTNIIADLGLHRVLIRSAAFELIENTHLDADDKALLKEWWNIHYLQGIAQVAGADWLSFGGHGVGVESGEERRKGASVMSSDGLRLPLNFLVWAQQCSSANMGLAWDSSANQRSKLRARALSDSRKERVIRNLAFQSMAVVSAPSRTEALVNSALRILLSIGAVMLAVPALMVTELDGIFAWLVVAGVILTTVEWDALHTLMKLFKPAPNARLILYRGNDSGTRL